MVLIKEGTVTVHRKARNSSGKPVIFEGKKGSSVESSGKILLLLYNNPEMTIPQLAQELGLSTRAVEKQIAKLRKKNRLERVGASRGGHWLVKPDE